MTTYNIMVDVDDVLTDTIGAIHALAHERGIHDNSVPMQTWHGHEQYGITLEEYLELWADFSLGGGFANMDPIVGSTYAVRKLAWAGHRIHIVTARGFLSHSREVQDQTRAWLIEHAVPFDSLTFAKDKVAAQDQIGYKFDYAVDDRWPNVSALMSDGVVAFLMNHDHNRFDPAPPDARVRDMAEFANVVLR